MSARSSQLVPAGVLVSVALAAELAPALQRGLQDLARDGVYASAEARAVLAQFENCRRANRYSPALDVAEEAVAEERDLTGWVTMQQAAEALAISRQAVKGRIDRGTLPAVRDESGRWRIDPSGI